ncbi:MAG: DNA pilot protein [Microviridae sp.]|nr:MAG: DNA pilot protein [Microviridae sp.]
MSWLSKNQSWLAPVIGGTAGFAIGGPVGAAIGLSGGGALGQMLGQKDANEANIASAREQMSFQERMSSTAHQREVEDLKKAGINPLMSANSGASTPVGAKADIENVVPDLSRSISSALEVLSTKKAIQEADSRIDLNKSSTELNRTKQGAEAPFAELGKWLSSGISSARKIDPEDLPTPANALRIGQKFALEKKNYIRPEEQKAHSARELERSRKRKMNLKYLNSNDYWKER